MLEPTNMSELSALYQNQLLRINSLLLDYKEPEQKSPIVDTANNKHIVDLRKFMGPIEQMVRQKTNTMLSFHDIKT